MHSFSHLAALSAASALLAMPPAPPPKPIDTVSAGKEFVLEKVLLPEKTTVVVFYQETSSADRALVDELKETIQNMQGQLGLRLVRLRTVDTPAAKQYEIRETPTLMVLDRFGNLLKRTSKPEEILPAIGKGVKMARIKWVNEDDPEAARAYRSVGAGKHPVAPIMKTMSLRPELMEGINQIVGMAHFTDGYLPRKTKEMIATYVSAINHCKFWVGSHAQFLQGAGADKETVDAVASDQVDKAKLSPKDLALLEFVEVLTKTPAKVTDAHVQKMRSLGWKDEEIFEAAFDTSLFAFFNRMADAYGLDYPMGGWKPREEKKAEGSRQ